MSALTKAEIIDRIVAELGFSRREAKDVVDAFFAEMHDALVGGGPIRLSGFGSFALRDKGARPGRNPRTGEEKTVSARRVVTFRSSQKLRDRVGDHGRAPEDAQEA